MTMERDSVKNYKKENIAGAEQESEEKYGEKRSSLRQWLKLVLFLIPVLTLFLGINFLADPGNIFHDFSDDMAQAMLDGKTVQVLSNNLDERKVAQHIIENMPDEVDTIVWGASVALCVDSDMAGTESFYNLAVSAADYYDLLAFVALMEENGKHAERIIFNIDSRIFDEAAYNGDARHNRLMEYSEYMLTKLKAFREMGGSTALAEKMSGVKKPEVSGEGTLWTQLSQLFSVSYFQWSVDYLKTQGTSVLFQERWQEVEQDSGVNRYLPDYSIVYADTSEAVTAEEVKQASEIYWMEGNVTPGAYAGAENKEIFETLVAYLQARGTEVELFLTPFAPSLWNRIYEEQYPMLFELQEYAGYLAEKYDLKLQGSYNPYDLEMTDADFYDARHVKKASLKAAYDFGRE